MDGECQGIFYLCTSMYNAVKYNSRRATRGTKGNFWSGRQRHNLKCIMQQAEWGLTGNRRGNFTIGLNDGADPTVLPMSEVPREIAEMTMKNEKRIGGICGKAELWRNLAVS